MDKLHLLDIKRDIKHFESKLKLLREVLKHFEKEYKK